MTKQSHTTAKEHEYLRRNLLHAKSCGVYYGIKSIIDRLNKLQNKPKWILEALNKELTKAEVVQQEMATHREEVKAGRESIINKLIAQQKQIYWNKK
jgi:hypothetical protein